MTRRAVPSAAVVVLSNASGRAFDTAVDRYVLKYLSGSLRTAPMSATHAAVAKVHGNAKTLHLPATLMAVGRRMNVPYVLVIEAIGKPKSTHVFVGLVDVQAKRTVLAHREALRGGKLNVTIGRALAERIEGAVSHAAPHSAPAVRPEAEPVAKAPAHHEAADDEDDASKAGKAKKAEALAERHAHKDKTAGDGSDLEHGMARGMLPKGRLWAGIELMQRVSRLKTPAVGGVTPPCYCGNSTNAQPFFPAFVIGGEITSGSFLGQRRRPQDGIGLHGEVTFAPVKTRVIRDGSTTNISSTVFAMNFKAFYRLALFPHKARTPDVTIGMGLHRFVFPLKGTQYTGVNYGAFDLGLKVDVPFLPYFGAFAGFDLRPGLKAGKQAQSLLGAPKAGFGFGLEAGLRAAVARFLVDLSFHFDRYQVPYTGTTNLPDMPAVSGTPVQFTNVKLTDQVLALLLRFQLAF